MFAAFTSTSVHYLVRVSGMHQLSACSVVNKGILVFDSRKKPFPSVKSPSTFVDGSFLVCTMHMQWKWIIQLHLSVSTVSKARTDNSSPTYASMSWHESRLNKYDFPLSSHQIFILPIHQRDYYALRLFSTLSHICSVLSRSPRAPVASLIRKQQYAIRFVVDMILKRVPTIESFKMQSDDFP